MNFWKPYSRRKYSRATAPFFAVIFEKTSRSGTLNSPSWDEYSSARKLVPASSSVFRANSVRSPRFTENVAVSTLPGSRVIPDSTKSRLAPASLRRKKIVSKVHSDAGEYAVEKRRDDRHQQKFWSVPFPTARRAPNLASQKQIRHSANDIVRI